MPMNPVRWFEIYVQEMPRAKKFYEAVFGVTLSLIKSPPSDNSIELWGFPTSQESYGASGALVKMPGMDSRGGGTIVYFASDDCAVEEKKIAKAGGKVERPKFSIGDYGFITLALDPEGNRIGVHSMK